MVGRSFVLAVRVAGITLFALVVIAGLIGNQSPFKNIAPTMVWVIGWVGLSFASALIGDIWAVVNPWDSLARFVERHHPRGNPLRSNSALPLSMPWLDAWPAVILFLLFAWCELIWDGSDRPRSLALALLGYSALTWAGMLLFDRPRWLRRGEIFSVAFGLFSRFAPLEAVADRRGHTLVLAPLCRRPAVPRPRVTRAHLLRAAASGDGHLRWHTRDAELGGPRRVDRTAWPELGRPSPRLASSAFLWRTSAFIWSRLG